LRVRALSHVSLEEMTEVLRASGYVVQSRG